MPDDSDRSVTSWRCTCCGRYRVDLIQLTAGPRPIPTLRITHAGILVAYCHSTAEVARHLDLGQLEPVPRARGSPMSTFEPVLNQLMSPIDPARKVWPPTPPPPGP